jgi:apolipoprotein N-acyltransferase
MLNKINLNWLNLVCGAVFALGFAPFQQPVFIYFALFGFFHQLQKHQRFQDGLSFGIGLSSIGLSWIYVSIHSYGHVNPLLSFFFTSLFVLVIASFYGAFAHLYGQLRLNQSSGFNPLILASSWCLFEWVRAHIFGGFPWLLLGFASLNTSFAKLLPWLGLYGPSFAITLAIACFIQVIHRHPKSILFSLVAVGLFLSPNWIKITKNPKGEWIEMGLIQDNVSMQNKWNEDLFWYQFNRYFLSIQDLIAPHRLVVLPEAAISIPSTFVHQELQELNHLAKNKNSALLLGIPQASATNPNAVFNTIMGLGYAVGEYDKRQLVLFGEEIPRIWHTLFKWLGVPIVTTLPGQTKQQQITVFGHPIATLICYELGYPEVLRSQVPKAQWIVSVSDDGWFGHSFAVYQHLQMAQTLSFMAQRPQLFVNNNGLSSIISAQGKILKQLPAWKRGQLIGKLQTHATWVPWMSLGDQPMQILVIVVLCFAFTLKFFSSFKIQALRLKNRLNPENL